MIKKQIGWLSKTAILGTIGLIAITGCSLGPKQLGSALLSKNKDTYYSTLKLNILEEALHENYIGELDENALEEGVYRGLVSSLDDAYSFYLTQEEYNKYEVERVGNYKGVGLEVTWGLNSQSLIVTGVISDSAADIAGIKIGDKIQKIDGIKAMLSNEMELYEKLFGGSDDTLVCEVRTKLEDEIKTIDLTPGFVTLAPFTAEVLTGNIGYIKDIAFKSTTLELLNQTLANWQLQNVSSIILDLRDTSSDQIEVAYKLSDMFLDTGIAFATTEKDITTPYETTLGSYDGRVVLLVNSGTSGVVEAFVRALQLNGQIQVVGTQTAGKGTLQKLIQLEDGSGLYLTTGYIFDGDGQSFNEKGITPDIPAELSTVTKLRYMTEGTISLEEDEIVQAAIEILK
jgi:carboxyl-terminal processing protease